MKRERITLAGLVFGFCQCPRFFSLLNANCHVQTPLCADRAASLAIFLVTIFHHIVAIIIEFVADLQELLGERSCTEFAFYTILFI